MSSVSQSTRQEARQIFKGVLQVSVSGTANPLIRQTRDIPIRYWIVKQATIRSGLWKPSICEKNIITDCFGRQIQFRIHNKSHYGKFLSDEFWQLCNGPSVVLCDGILEDIQDNYFPYTMIFKTNQNYVFYMATNSCNYPMDFID